MDKKKTGELIKSARIEKNYTQAELGDLVGVSNKAVSRWETGESFPDIGVLENLSQILGLKIEDIVKGELVEQADENMAAEIIRAAKMQAAQKKRQAVETAVQGAMIFYFCFSSFFVFTRYENGNGSFWRYAVSMLIVFALFSIKAAEKKDLTNPFYSSRHKWQTIISIVTGVYAFAMMYVCISCAQRGEMPFHLEMNQAGPFLNAQLILVFLINFGMIFFQMLCMSRNHDSIRLDLYIMAAVIHLTWSYSDMLHRLSDMETVFGIFWQNTIILAAEAGLFLILPVMKKIF